MTIYLQAAIALAVLVFLGVGIHGLQEASQAKGEAEYLRTVVERDSVRIDSLKTEHNARESEYADSLLKLSASRFNSEKRAREAEAREEAARNDLLDATLALDAAVSDTTVQRLIREERTVHEREKTALRERIGELEAQLSVANRTIGVHLVQIADRDEMIAALNVSVEDARAEARAWERAANPGWVASVVRNVPGVLTGAAAVLVVLVVI